MEEVPHTNIRVRFADEKMEADLPRLASSSHPEDKQLHEHLRQIRAVVAARHRTGRRISEHAVPGEYRQLFGIDNLWVLETPGQGEVLYSYVGDEIWIVDER